jgi:hypothetical protein
MAKNKSGKRKVGTWKIKRVSGNQLTVTIPSGLAIRNDAPVAVEDLLSDIASHMAANKGAPGGKFLNPPDHRITRRSSSGGASLCRRPLGVCRQADREYSSHKHART